jgi:hypothetical protein
MAPCQLAWHESEFCQLEYDANHLAFRNPQPLAAFGGERLGIGSIGGTNELTSKLLHP